jgi:sugar lactone lactonase YvrE
MRKRLQQQVNPKITAIAILIVLASVQAIWWRKLVWHPPAPQGPGAQSGGRGGPMVTIVVGREDVLVDTLAGTPEPGDADGPGRDARFDGPAGLALDRAGNLYVADCHNHRIRRIAPDGRTTTIAGGAPGYADGPAALARFNLPCGIAVGPDGSLYVADTGNDRIRRIRNGMVTTLAGSAAGMADGSGPAARFDLPCAIAYVPGPPPGLLVADARNRRVRRVSLEGATGGGWLVPGAPTALSETPPTAAVPEAGALVGASRRVARVPVDAKELASFVKPGELELRRPVALCPAPDGWYAADDEYAAVFYIHGGTAEVLAGASCASRRMDGWRDGTGITGAFGRIGGLAADGRGHIYVSDTANNAIRRVTLPGASPDGEERGAESRDRTTDEGLRRWNRRRPGYQPGYFRGDFRPARPQRSGQEYPDVYPRNAPGPYGGNGPRRGF